MPPDASSPSLRERIGGESALSWTSATLLVLGGAAITASNDPGSFANWAAIVIPATLVMLAVMGLAEVTVLRHRRVHPVPVATVVAVTHALGVELARPWQAILLATGVLGAVAVPGLALVLDNVVRHRHRRAHLRARLIALREREGERLSLSDALTDAAYAETMDALAEVREQIDVPTGAETSEERLAMAHHLRRTMDSTLRPLSHRLYATGRVSPGTGPSWRALRAFVRAQPVFPAATAAMVSLFMIPVAINPIGGIIMGAVTFVLLQTAHRVARHSRLFAGHEFALAAALTGAGSALAAIAIRGTVADGFSPTAVAAGAIIPMVLLIITSTAITAMRGEDALTTSLEEEVTAREVDGLVADSERARASRDLAQYVHGTPQSHLLATAFTIERAVGANDDVAYARAVEEARAALQSVPMDHASSGAKGLAAEVAESVELWAGFMQVDAHTDPALDTLPRGVVVDVGRVVGEALGNAWKHGRARAVSVQSSPPDAVVVRVADDGLPPAGGTPGMGSAWLDFIAPGAWALLPSRQGGSMLEVRLAVAPLAVMGPGHA